MKISLSPFLQATGALSLVAAFAFDRQAETMRPGIINILADDLGYAGMGCFGNTFYETPHLDNLAVMK